MGFLSIERKFLDTALQATALVAPTDASGGEFDPSTTVMMSTPGQGDGPSQRDGKEIAMLYLQFNCVLNIPKLEIQADAPSGCSIFVAIVLDTQTNAAQMNSEDCFTNPAAAALNAATPLKNLLFGKRFRILKERVFQMDVQTLSHFAVDSFSFGGVTKTFKWFIPLNGMKVRFNAGTSTSIANCIDNSLHVIAYASNIAILAPTIAYSARLRFVG